MSLPVWTTTISVMRVQEDPHDEPYAGPPTLYAVATGVHAVIDIQTFGVGAGRDQVRGGEQTTTTLRLLCDLCDMTNADWVYDERAAVYYRVAWYHRYLSQTPEEHIQAGIRTTEGLV